MLNWSLSISRSNVIPHSIDPVYRTGFVSQQTIPIGHSCPLFQKYIQLALRTRGALWAAFDSLNTHPVNESCVSGNDGSVPIPAQKTHCAKSIDSAIAYKGVKRAKHLVYKRPGSCSCSWEKEYGRVSRHGVHHAWANCAADRQVSAGKRWASTATRASLSPQASPQPPSTSSQNPPSATQPSRGLFPITTTRNTVESSLRIGAFNATIQGTKKGGQYSGTKLLSWRFGNSYSGAEERRLGSGVVPLAHPIALWTLRFANINAARVRKARHLVSSRRRNPLLTLGRYSAKPKTSSAPRWKRMSQDKKLQRWYPALIHALQFDPEKAMMILEDNLTNDGCFFPEHVGKDCLHYLACTYLQDAKNPPRSSTDTLHRVSCLFLATYGRLKGSASLSQSTVYLLSKHYEGKKFLTFLDHLQHNNVYMHTNTKFHLMARCATLGKIGIALSFLETIPAAELAGVPAQSFCVSLLRADMEVDDLYGLRSNILAYMLKVGVRPNRQLANIIILNAMEAGDFNTAWRSHEIAQENGLLPDVFTYIWLLKGVQHGDDKAKISYIHRCAATDGSLATSARLKFEILHAFYVTEERGPHWRHFMDLLSMYCEFFNVQPLIDLRILHDRQSPQQTDVQQMPTVPALGLMVLAWLRTHSDISQVQQVYEHYLQHVRAGHPVIAQLAETDHTANAFLHVFGSHTETLPLCTQIVQHMLESSSADLSAESKNISATESEPHPPRTSESPTITLNIAAPTVQTWNILLHSFIRNRKALAAEKVLTIMQARGHEPNQVTWNTLLGGYASMQDVAGVVKSMRRLEKTDMESDEWTMKALRRVADKEALLEALEGNSGTRPVQGAKELVPIRRH